MYIPGKCKSGAPTAGAPCNFSNTLRATKRANAKYTLTAPRAPYVGCKLLIFIQKRVAGATQIFTHAHTRSFAYFAFICCARHTSHAWDSASSEDLEKFGRPAGIFYCFAALRPFPARLV
jgi:hypothetical protein